MSFGFLLMFSVTLILCLALACVSCDKLFSCCLVSKAWAFSSVRSIIFLQPTSKPRFRGATVSSGIRAMEGAGMKPGPGLAEQRWRCGAVLGPWGAE